MTPGGLGDTGGGLRDTTCGDRDTASTEPQLQGCLRRSGTDAGRCSEGAAGLRAGGTRGCAATAGTGRFYLEPSRAGREGAKFQRGRRSGVELLFRTLTSLLLPCMQLPPPTPPPTPSSREDVDVQCPEGVNRSGMRGGLHPQGQDEGVRGAGQTFGAMKGQPPPQPRCPSAHCPLPALVGRKRGLPAVVGARSPSSRPQLPPSPSRLPPSLLASLRRSQCTPKPTKL